MPYDPENDPLLKLKLQQAEEDAGSYPDYRRGAKVVPCGCLFFGVIAAPLLYLGGSVSNILLVLFFALAGGLLAGMAAAFRPR